MLITQSELLIDHPDRLKWNQKYSQYSSEKILPHPILSTIQTLNLPQAPILEIACGLSGNVISLARLGYSILAIDISEVALNSLANILKENNLEHKVTLIQADLGSYDIPKESFALILGVKYWDKNIFKKACHGVIAGGILAWETFNKKHLCYHPNFNSKWCLEEDEPASLLPNGFEVMVEEDFDTTNTRRLIARYKNKD